MQLLKLLNWRPPDLWETYFPDVSLSLQTYLWGWILNQLSCLLQTLISFCLVLPTEFIQGADFTKFYLISVVFGFAFLRGGVGVRIIKTLWHKKGRFTTEDGYELVFRGFVSVIVVTLAPKLFSVFSTLSVNLTASLSPLATLDLNLVPTTGSEEISLIILAIVIGISAVRLLVFYAVRNVYLLLLLLVFPIATFRWVATGSLSHLEKIGRELGGILLIQIIHVFLFALMVQLGQSSVPEGIRPVFWGLFTQIGAMQLMLNSDLLLELVLGRKVSFAVSDQTDKILEFVKSKGASLLEGN